jgi:DNA polymerase-3 subunit alpha
LITGFLKQRYNRDDFDFKVTSVTLAETMKRNMTRQVSIETHPQSVSKELVTFFEKNIRNYPGKATLKITLTEPRNKLKISLVSMNSGFEMNDEMIQFLEKRPELDVQVTTS